MARKHREPVVWIREERTITAAELVWLQSPEAQAVCDEMAASNPADTPAAIARWRERLEPGEVAAAWHQVTLRRAARKKFSKADGMLFDRVGLEQATDEVVAAWKARRFRRYGQVADLCCGIGGDAIALAEHAEVTAIDWSRTRTLMAAHNAAVYKRKVAARAGDIVFERPDAAAVHIDPDRRPGRGRRVDPNEGSPDLQTLRQIIADYRNAAIKLSPGVVFEDLGIDGEIELISHQAECKQAVVWSGGLASSRRRATGLPSGETLAVDSDELPPWPESRPPQRGDVLHEPDAAVIRAHLVGLLAERHGLQPIDPRIAYLVGLRPIDSELVTAYRVWDCVPWSLKEARGWLKGYDVGSIDIKTRGFAARPEEIVRRLRLKGRRRAVLFLTRVGERPTAILGERL